MIRKLIIWLITPMLKEQEASRAEMRRWLLEEMDIEYQGRFRDFVNEQVEGAIGQCQEHATQTAQDAVTRLSRTAAPRDVERLNARIEALKMRVEELEIRERNLPVGTRSIRPDVEREGPHWGEGSVYEGLIRELTPRVYKKIVDELVEVVKQMKDANLSGRVLELQNIALSGGLNRPQLVEVERAGLAFRKSPMAAAILALSAKEFSKQLAQHVDGIEPERLDEVESRVKWLEELTASEAAKKLKD